MTPRRPSRQRLVRLAAVVAVLLAAGVVLRLPGLENADRLAGVLSLLVAVVSLLWPTRGHPDGGTRDLRRRARAGARRTRGPEPAAGVGRGVEPAPAARPRPAAAAVGQRRRARRPLAEHPQDRRSPRSGCRSTGAGTRSPTSSSGCPPAGSWSSGTPGPGRACCACTWPGCCGSAAHPRAGPGPAVVLRLGPGDRRPARVDRRTAAGGRGARPRRGRGRRATGDGRSVARAMVDGGHLVPILDGLDELPASTHRAAVEAINAAPPGPLVLTSRRAEFAAATALDRGTAAAVVPRSSRRRRPPWRSGCTGRRRRSPRARPRAPARAAAGPPRRGARGGRAVAVR